MLNLAPKLRRPQVYELRSYKTKNYHEKTHWHLYLVNMLQRPLFDSLNACTRWHVNAVIALARQAGRPAGRTAVPPPAPFTASQSSHRRNRVRHRLFPLPPPCRANIPDRTATRLLNSTYFRARASPLHRSQRSAVVKECGNGTPMGVSYDGHSTVVGKRAVQWKGKSTVRCQPVDAQRGRSVRFDRLKRVDVICV